jgi:hypothetical protein
MGEAGTRDEWNEKESINLTWPCTLNTSTTGLEFTGGANQWKKDYNHWKEYKNKYGPPRGISEK